MIETINSAFAAGEAKTFLVNGEYFELVDVPLGTVDVVLSDANGAQVTRMIGAEASFFCKPGHFGAVSITSATAQTVKFIVADGTAGTRRTAGFVRLSDQLTSFVNTAKTVTNADAQLIAANAARRYLLIQNNNATGSIFVTFGVAATLALGVKIIPGGNLELSGPVSLQEIRAIGDIASNANVVVLEA